MTNIEFLILLSGILGTLAAVFIIRGSTRNSGKDDMAALLRTELERIHQRERDVILKEEALTEKTLELSSKYEEMAGISHDEALSLLLTNVAHTHHETLLARAITLAQERESVTRTVALDVLLQSVSRLANALPRESFTYTIDIPSPLDKAKLIGKDGKNHKHFQDITGADLLISDDEQSVTISCFDPLRRALARDTVRKLLAEGKVYPSIIEDTYSSLKQEQNTSLVQAGEQACKDVGLMSLPPEIHTLLGMLQFRTSYGQNVLTHSIEMAHIARYLAEEVGANPEVCASGALLHDIGKAVDHTFKGSHVDIGIKILRKYGVSEAIIDAMKSHHGEYPYLSKEAVVVQAADAISAARPGARKQDVEKHIDRLINIEKLKDRFLGVERIYAYQAGREVRAYVSPALVSDFDAITLAAQIAKVISDEFQYPGEIKVYVVRESIAIEWAR